MSAEQATEPAISRGGGLGLTLALEILEQVARQPRALPAADIARLVGAPRATVYRVLNTLVRDEYLVRRADFSGFMLGTRVLELAAVVDAHRTTPLRGILDSVRESTGEIVHLVAFHAAGISVLDEDPRQPVSDRETLLRDPTRSAAGHLWLSERRPDDLPSSATRWSARVTAGDVEAITAAVTARGYAEQAGLLRRDGGCLAVPVRSSDAGAVGALALATTAAGLALAARHVSTLRSAAALLADSGAFRPSPA